MAFEALQKLIVEDVLSRRKEERQQENPLFKLQLKGQEIQNRAAEQGLELGELNILNTRTKRSDLLESIQKRKREQEARSMLGEALASVANQQDIPTSDLTPYEQKLIEVDPTSGQSVVKLRRKLAANPQAIDELISMDETRPFAKVLFPKYGEDSKYQNEFNLVQERGRQQRQTDRERARLQKELADEKNKDKLDEIATREGLKNLGKIVDGNIRAGLNNQMFHLKTALERFKSEDMSSEEFQTFVLNAEEVIDAAISQMEGKGWFTESGQAETYRKQTQEYIDRGDYSGLWQFMRRLRNKAGELEKVKTPETPVFNLDGTVKKDSANTDILPVPFKALSGKVSVSGTITPIPLENGNVGIVSSSGKKIDFGISIEEFKKLGPEGQKEYLSKRVKAE